MKNRARHTWGGARRGAGRPASRAIASEPHKTRPALAARPVHVTARLAVEVRIAARLLRPALARALSRARGHADFRIIELALRADRVELIVEADDKRALARGMQGFQISAARALNRIVRRTGNVFPDRYRARVLASRAAGRAARGADGGEQICTPTSPLLR